jgi:serine/threonine-protein kinase
MEWVAGHDLATLLHRHGPFSPVQVAWVGAQTARALAAAHAARIVHRDVKPANLLFARGDGASASMAGGDGLVKLADFGIAVPVESPQGGGPEAGPLLGTAAYVSPEQVMGRPAGPASDLYALGCTLYELLIGEPPFSGDDPLRVMRLHLTQEPAPPGRLRADVPARLERLVSRLLTKDESARPADAREVAEALESISAAPSTAGAQWAPTGSAARTPEVHGPVVAARHRPGGQATPTAVMPAPAPAISTPDMAARGEAAPGRAKPAAEPSATRPRRGFPGRVAVAAAAVVTAVLVAAFSVTTMRSPGRSTRAPAMAVSPPATTSPTSASPRVRKPAAPPTSASHRARNPAGHPTRTKEQRDRRAEKPPPDKHGPAKPKKKRH